MPAPHRTDIESLVDQWGAHFGWFDGKINLGVRDLSSFATPDATLTAHAPVWGTRESAERPIPIADVRRRLARIMKVARARRDDMHLAIHPAGDQMCLFVRFRARLAFPPVTVRTEPLAFVVKATETADGLRICTVDEWSAADPEAARRILVGHHGWPADTALHPQVAFGAAS